MRCLRSNQSVNRRRNVSLCHGWHRRAYAFCMQWILSKMALRDVTVPNCWIKSLCFFLFLKKVFSSLHNVTLKPLMADGVFWWCLSYFSGPWQCYLLDSHKPPGFHTNILNCVLRRTKLLLVWTTWGISFLTNDKKKYFGVEYPFKTCLMWVCSPKLHWFDLNNW